MGWNTEVAIGGADASRATNTQVAIYSKWVTAAGVMQKGQNVMVRCRNLNTYR